MTGCSWVSLQPQLKAGDDSRSYTRFPAPLVTGLDGITMLAVQDILSRAGAHRLPELLPVMWVVCRRAVPREFSLA